jgi:hypothetical protein
MLLSPGARDELSPPHPATLGILGRISCENGKVLISTYKGRYGQKAGASAVSLWRRLAIPFI